MEMTFIKAMKIKVIRKSRGNELQQGDEGQSKQDKPCK